GGAVGVAVFAALHQVDTGVLMAAAGLAMVVAAFICLRVQQGEGSGLSRGPAGAGRLTSAGPEPNGPRSGPRSRLSDWDPSRSSSGRPPSRRDVRPGR